MGDAVEFAVDVSTTIDTIANMKTRIKTYVNSNLLCFSIIHSIFLLFKTISAQKQPTYYTLVEFS